MSSFKINVKLVRIMNIIGAWLFVLMGVALIINKFGEQPLSGLFLIAAVYAFFIAIPAGTARALGDPTRHKLRRGMLKANGFFLGLWALSFCVTLYTHAPILMALISAVFLVLPPGLNMLALGRIEKEYKEVESRRWVKPTH